MISLNIFCNKICNKNKKNLLSFVTSNFNKYCNLSKNNNHISNKDVVIFQRACKPISCRLYCINAINYNHNDSVTQIDERNNYLSFKNYNSQLNKINQPFITNSTFYNRAFKINNSINLSTGVLFADNKIYIKELKCARTYKTSTNSIWKNPKKSEINDSQNVIDKNHLIFSSKRINLFKRMYSTQLQDETAGYKLIYTGVQSHMVRAIKMFSLSTSVLGLGLQPVLFQQIGESIILGLALILLTNVFIFITPLLLHFVTKRYVTEMRYNETSKKFKATTLSFFLREKALVFDREEVSDPKSLHMLTNIVVRNKVPLFFDPAAFTDKEAYIQLMKYDIPLEWQIDKVEKKDDS